MKKKCNCKKWKTYISSIETGLSLAWSHFPEGYNMEVFNYCPWCGKSLKIEAPPIPDIPESENIYENCCKLSNKK
jgi:hypothetical protein